VVAMRERLASPLAMWFQPALEREVTRQKRLVEGCLDDVRERAVQRGWATLAPHWKACLPKGAHILVRLGRKIASLETGVSKNFNFVFG
jgi:hypothetical protein